MPKPPLAAPLLALALLTGLGATPPAVGAIFKCRSGDGHWLYAARPPPDCQGRPTILPLTPRGKPPVPAPAGRRVEPPAPSRARLRARLHRDEATLRALHATRVPRDPALARWRTHALQAVTVDIAALRRHLAAR